MRAILILGLLLLTAPLAAPVAAADPVCDTLGCSHRPVCVHEDCGGKPVCVTAVSLCLPVRV